MSYQNCGHFNEMREKIVEARNRVTGEMELIKMAVMPDACGMCGAETRAECGRVYRTRYVLEEVAVVLRAAAGHGDN